MKKFLIPLITIILALSSCGSENGGNITLASRIDRSGDLLISKASTYNTTSNGRSYEQMMASMDGGENVLFLFASYNCSHCLDFESTFIKFMRANQPNMYIYYLADKEIATALAYDEIRYGLAEYYGYTDGTTPFGSTPILYLGTKDNYYVVSEGNQTQSYVENAVKSYADYSNLYYFSSFDYFEQASSNDILTILYSQSDEASLNTYYDQIYETANDSDKTTYVLDYDVMSEEDQTKALSYFGLDSYSLSYSINRENIDEERVFSYYGVN